MGQLPPSRCPPLRSNVEAALRALASKTRVVLPHLDLVTTSSGADRDPRGWSVSVLYYALLPSDQVPAVAGDKTEAIEWCNPERPGHRLAFDHAQLLERVLATLRDKVERGGAAVAFSTRQAHLDRPATCL